MIGQSNCLQPILGVSFAGIVLILPNIGPRNKLQTLFQGHSKVALMSYYGCNGLLTILSSIYSAFFFFFLLCERSQNEVLPGLKGREVIADDILCFGSRETVEQALADHDYNLLKSLKRHRSVNLMLNKKKLRLHAAKSRHQHGPVFHL